MNGKRSILLLALASTLLLATAFVPPPPQSPYGGGPVDLKFSGVIDGFDNVQHMFTIAGIPVERTSATHFKLTTDTLAVGMWADVMGSWQDGTLVAKKLFVKPPDVRLKGPIQSRPDGDLGVWVIAGQSITVNEYTRICDRCGSLDPPAWAEVHAFENELGQLVADRLAGIETMEWIEVYGAIQAFDDDSWVLSTIELAVDDGATVVAGDPRIGVLAHAEAMLDGATLVALKLRPVWIEPGSPEAITAPPVD
jgi:hypothetical protein